MQEESPALSTGEVAKVVGARWKELTEEEKQPYVERAAEEKEKRAAEMAEYAAMKAEQGEEEEEEPVEKKKKKKSKKDPNAPKQAKNGFMFYLDATRESVKVRHLVCVLIAGTY